MRRADIHQHFWPEALLSSLARRTDPPRLRDGWLELAGEAPSRFDPGDHDAAERAALAAADGVQRVLIAPSTPAALPDELLEEWFEGVRELGSPFEPWAALPEQLDRGAAGLCLPAGALVDRERLHALGPALEALAVRGAPLFVHPGPASAPDAPAWWAPLNGYVADMAAAWYAWAAWGRREHPRLRVIFAMLAGLAPLHAERLAARGGPADAVHDPLTAFDTSSYGPQAVDAMLRAVGVDRLLYGSDRPVVQPQSLASLGIAAEHAITAANHPAWAS